jgi:serine/threonine protein kinase/tetratricopeptide (TPR) repeat protein
MRELREGDMLDGKYRILAPIGRGGMGVVYSALRLALGDNVAIKLLIPSHDMQMSRARFLREAKAAARIRHPSVVQVFDYGDPDDGAPYIVMELLDGPTLGDHLHRAGALPLERALGVIADVCAAVEAGHRRGVVHRDLKPGNVILARTDDGGEVCKVLDFGIASLVGIPDATTLTSPGALIGTYGYMSPEQVNGAVAGPRSDVFALGVILYEMITREVPFAAPSPVATMMRIARGDHTPITKHLPSLPPSLVLAIAAALSLDPEKRPASPEAFARLAGAPMRSTRAMLDSIPDTGRALGTDSSAGVASWSDATVLDRTMPDLERHFVGRAQEMARIEEQARSARFGDGKLVVVLGDAGIGKTRLVQAFARRAEDLGARVSWARFYGYDGSRMPAFEAITRMLEGDKSTPRPPERIDSERGDARWQRFEAIAKALAARADVAPLVLAFDDLQWASAVELELVAYLHRALDPKRAFLIATARTPSPGSEVGKWIAQLGHRRAAAIVEVRPLGSDHVSEYLSAAFGSLRIRPKDRRRIESVTGNNPSHLLELVRHLMTTDAIRRDGVQGVGEWSCAALDEVTLPESMSSVVRAKIGELDARLLEALELAAVIGYEQRLPTLRAATGMTEDDVDAIVERGIESGFLTDVGVSKNEDVRFASETLRRVLYEEMTPRRRKRAHQRVVLALEELYAKDLRRIARVLCYHHHAVGNFKDALSWGMVAAEDDLALYSNDAAEASLDRARDASARLEEAGEPPAALDAARVDWLTGSLYVRLGRYAEASDRLTRAAANLEPRSSMRIDALLDLTHCYLGRGELERALVASAEAHGASTAMGDSPRAFMARTLTAMCLNRLGKAAAAEATLMAAMETAGSEVPAASRSHALRELSFAATKRGAFAIAEERAREALDLARAANDPVAQHAALGAIGAAYNEGGDPASALPHQLEALKIARTLSLRRREAIELANLGESYMSLGQVALAEQHFREALAIFLEIDDRACEGDCRVNVGRALLASGSRAAAIAMLERGRKLCAATGRVEYAGLADLHIGDAYRAQSDLASAGAHYADALRLFVEQASHHTWRAALGLAHVAHGAGDIATAHSHATDARERLVAQRVTLAIGASTETVDKSLAEIDRVLAETTA